MWACVRKKVKMRQQEQKREIDLFNGEDGGHNVFSLFCFQERNEKRKEKWKNKPTEADSRGKEGRTS